MKIRHSFVSNSSSTSFIVPPDEFSLKLAEKYSLTLINVGKLKILLQKDPELLSCELWWVYQDGLNELDDSYYISRPFDRDLAWELGINFRIFQEDL